MPATTFDFEFGEFAITTPESASPFATRSSEVQADIQPETVLEAILTDEIIHAGWELERVRQLAHHRDAETRLASATSRASRNWHRARKYLKKLQRAEASRYCCTTDVDAQDRAATCPLADLTKLPQPVHFPTEAK